MKTNIGTLFITLLLVSVSVLYADNSCLESWEEFSRSPEKAQLIDWMKETAGDLLIKNKLSCSCNIPFVQQGICSGLFVTLVHKGKVRGCYGAFSHRNSSLLTVLKEYIRGALFLDPRHKPLERHELEDTEIILTVASDPEPVDDINNVDISNSGVLIECEDSTKTVIVPAEFKTTSGILKHTKKTVCRYYRFRAVTIR